MMAYEKIGEISVAKILRDFIGDEVLPGTDIGAGQFWSGLAGLVGEFAPRIRDQLRFRDELQETNASAAYCLMPALTASMILRLMPSRSSRLIPGLRGTPAVTTTTLAPAIAS